MATEKQYRIVRGPSELGLMFALFDKERGARQVTFVIDCSPDSFPELPVGVEVTQLVNDGAGNWLVSGTDGVDKPYRAYYNSHKREGTFAFANTTLVSRHNSIFD